MAETNAELDHDDALLAETQTHRMKLARDILAKPHDQVEAKDTANALKALDGVDKQIMAKRRLVMEDKQGNEHAKSAALIASVLAQIGSSRPYRLADHEIDESAPIPTLPDDFPRPEMVPGEMSKTPLKSSIEEFMGTSQ